MKLCYKLRLIPAVILLCANAYAQPTDSMKAREYLEQLKEIANYNPDSAYELGRKAELIADYQLQNSPKTKIKSVFLKIKGDAVFNLACINHMQGKFNEAEAGYLRTIEIQKQNRNYRELANTYNYLSRIYENRGEGAEFFRLMQKALKLHTRLKDTTGAAMDLIGIADYYFRAGHTDSCLINYEQALRSLRQTHQSEKLAFCLYQYAVILRRLNQKEKAIELLYEALELQETVGNTHAMAQSCLDLGYLFSGQEAYEKAQDYFERAYNLSLKIKSKNLEAKAFAGLGKIHDEQNQPERSLEYYESALRLVEETGAGPGVMALCLNNVGMQHKKMGHRKEAISFLQRALDVGKDHSLPDLRAGLMLNLGSLNYESGEYDRAREYAQQSFNLAQKAGTMDIVLRSAKLLSEIYEALGNLKPALSFLRISEGIKDSVEHAKNTRLLLEKEAEYEVKKKEYELLLSQQRVKLLEEEQKLESRTWAALVSGLLLLLICGSLGVAYRNQKRRTREQKMNAELLTRVQEIEFLREQVNTKLVENSPSADEDLSHYLGVNLSRREIEVLHELCKGKSNKEISESLYISVNTVRSHLLSIYNKLDVKNRTQAVKKAVNLNLAD